MTVETYVKELEATRVFFDRSISIFEPKDSTFAPVPGIFTVANQIAHVAQTFDWFMEGAFRPEGFSMDWEKLENGVRAVTTLGDALAWWNRAMDAAIAKTAATSAREFAVLLPEGPIMGGSPRGAIIGALVDHTAHHRGALTVYARLLGKQSPMPYM
jgi:uncharacterized damage-inducible protein DinB